ncbi:hypothetical protein, partial [Acinetobacter guillouiae]|uniref:hypothetical protein n=1 Tax=Acinetobacter guillouiae TaxID=106649 RepID=UPI0026E11BDF
ANPDDTRSDDLVMLHLGKIAQAEFPGIFDEVPEFKADYFRTLDDVRPLSTGDYAKHALGQAAQGAVDFVVASPLKTIAAGADFLDRNV